MSCGGGGAYEHLAFQEAATRSRRSPRRGSASLELLASALSPRAAGRAEGSVSKGCLVRKHVKHATDDPATHRGGGG